LTPDFNAVLFVEVGDETFFFPTFVGAEERRLK
jgi:hypothetical protein